MGGTAPPWETPGSSDNRDMDEPTPASLIARPQPRGLPCHRARGVTLIELVVVVAIIGIISAVALPVYRQHVAKGRRADAITALSNVVQAQERWRTNNSNYAGSLTTLFPNSTSPDVSSGGHYGLTLSGLGAPASFVAGFTIAATPTSGGLQSSDSDCASMSIQVAGGNLIYAATDSGGSDSSQRCWPK